METIGEHKTGFIGTLVFHAVMLILLILFGFFTPLPLPGEEGILVNFGDSETGLGEIEPSPAIVQPEPTQKEKKEEEIPVPVAPKVKQPPKPVKEEIMTQDFEQTAAIEAAKKKKEEDRQQQLELDRQRQAEVERQRIEAEARKKQEEENRRIAEIDNRTKGAFGKTNTGTGGTGSGTGQSQGVTYPGGNQGVPTGDPNASTYGPGSSGSGNKGAGISYSLSGRSATSTPKPSYPGSEEGTVVVKITVDKNGKVTVAEPGQRGSTTMNPDLLDAAKRAALQAKFNVDNDAPAFQTGTITYRFIQSQ
jgi:colicin import membrane protein